MQSKPLQAVGLMLASMFAFATMSATVRLLSAGLPSTEIVFLRNAWSVLLIVLWTWALQRRRPDFSTLRLRSHFWRAGVGFLSMQLWFYALSVMPLNLATALSFTTPIFATIFAIVFLREKAGVRRWSAIAIGFTGMLVMLHPGDQGLPVSALIVLASSALMAWAGILVKSLTHTEAPETIVFYMSFFMLILSVPPAMMHWQPVDSYQLWLAFLIALFSTIAHLLLTRAYVRAEMVMLMPFDFTRLIFAAIYAHVLFNETLDAHTLAGGFIIVASTVYIAHREAKLRKAARAIPTGS
jgi:drug/metabolite transporter (DMT)-like permease